MVKIEGVQNSAIAVKRLRRTSGTKIRPSGSIIRQIRQGSTDGNTRRNDEPCDDSSLCDTSDSEESAMKEYGSSESDTGQVQKRKCKGRNKRQEHSSDSSGYSSVGERKRRKRGAAKKNMYPGIKDKCTKRRRRGKYHVYAAETSRESSDSESGEVPDELHYRGNVPTAVLELRKMNLSDVHLKSIKLTPFWYFVECALSMSQSDLSSYKKHDATTAEIVRRYNCSGRKGQKGFHFGEIVVRPRRGDVELIFGVRGGSDTVHVSNTPIEANTFVDRCFPEKYRRIVNKIGGEYLLRKRLIIDAISTKTIIPNPSEEVCEDIARLVHLHLLSVLFTPNQNCIVPWHITEYLVDFKSICLYDWGGYILKTLLSGIKRAKKYRVTGCSVFLLFWLCELIPITEAKHGDRVFPRFLKWNLKDLKRKLLRRDIDRLDKEFEILKELTPSTWEVARLDGEIPGMDELPLRVDHSGKNDPCHARVLCGEPDLVEEAPVCEQLCIDVAGESVAVSTSCQTPIGIDLSNTCLNVENGMSSCGSLSMTGLLVGGGSGLNSDEVISPGKNDTGNASLNPDPPAIPSNSCPSPIFNWINYLDFDPPSFDLLSPDKCNAKQNTGVHKVGGMQIATTSGVGCNLVDVTPNVDIAADSEVSMMQKEISRLNAQLELTDALQLASENENQKTYISELESQVLKLEGRLKDCECARSRMVSKITLLEQSKGELEKSVFQYQSLYDKERLLNAKLDAENSLYVEECGIQKSRITELIMECDFLRVDVQRLNENVSKLENQLVPMSQTPSTFSDGYTGGNVQAKSDSKSLTFFHTPIKPTNLFKLEPTSATPSTSSYKIAALQSKSPTLRNKTTLNSSPLQPINKAVILNSPSVFVTPSFPVVEKKVGTGSTGLIVINSSSPVTDTVRIARQHEDMVMEAIGKVAKKGGVHGGNPAESSVTDGNCLRPMNLNRKKEVVQHLDIIATTCYANQFNALNCKSAILQLMTSYASAQVSLVDIETILSHDRYNEAIMDTWALLIQEQVHGQQSLKDTRRNVGAKPFIFRSFCWKYVACFEVDSSYKRGCTVFVDDKIPDALNYEHWLIPLNTSTDSSPHDTTGDNWTLLHYDVNANYWTFYNSMPAARIDQDVHLRASNILINFIENRIRHYCEATGRRVPVFFQPGQVGSNIDTPRQPRNSLDCGTVICSVIEKLISGKQVTPANWTVITAGRYRAYMAKCFYDVIMKRCV